MAKLYEALKANRMTRQTKTATLSAKQKVDWQVGEAPQYSQLEDLVSA